MYVVYILKTAEVISEMNVEFLISLLSYVGKSMF